MRKKDGTMEYSWSELVYRIDPELSAPEKVYVFDNGNRVFYQDRYMDLNMDHQNQLDGDFSPGAS